MRAPVNTLLAVIATATLLGACGSSDSTPPDVAAEEAPRLVETTTTTSVPVAAEPSEPADDPFDPMIPEPEPLDQGGIVTAVVLIAGGGDLEAAILEGVVTEAEAEAALLALESGTLDELLGAD